MSEEMGEVKLSARERESERKEEEMGEGFVYQEEGSE